MCNNNGHCRKFDAGTMCPSYRATRDEQHLTRGRANTLRLALSGQLGRMLDLATACTRRWTCASRARAASANARPASTWRSMKIEFLAHYKARHGYSLRDRAGRLPAALCAVGGARFAPLANCGYARRCKGLLGFAPQRALPKWRGRLRSHDRHAPGARRRARGRAVRRHLQPLLRARERARRARACSQAAGYRVHVAQPPASAPAAVLRPHVPRRGPGRRSAKPKRSACSTRCGRTSSAALPVVGLEPSCLFTLPRRVSPCCSRARDAESRATPICSRNSSRASEAGRLELQLKALPQRRRCCTATATRRRSAPCRRWRTCSAAGAGARSRDDRVELLRHGGQLRLRGRALRRSR